MVPPEIPHSPTVGCGGASRIGTLVPRWVETRISVVAGERTIGPPGSSLVCEILAYCMTYGQLSIPAGPQFDTIMACRILYSTQSGRSKACARRVARILHEHSTVDLRSNDTFDATLGIFDGTIVSLADSMKSEHSLLVLFVSTTGDGEHTDTIQDTWIQLLQKSLPRDTFQGIKFALYCLGDRAYGPQFCAAGRKLAVRLLQLGAKLVCEPGYGDDGTPNGGVFADLDLWIDQQLVPLLQQQGQWSPPVNMETQKTPLIHKAAASFSAQMNQRQQDCDTEGTSEAMVDFARRLRPRHSYTYHPLTLAPLHERHPDATRPILATVVENRRLTADDWEQDTRHIILKVSGEKGSYPFTARSLPYRAGDVVAVLPSNAPTEVQRFIQQLPDAIQQVVDRQWHVTKKPTGHAIGACEFWPSTGSLREWLTHCADIHALPEREDLRAISSFCSTEHPLGRDQRDKLLALSETKGGALYGDYILRQKRSWADVLYDFDSLRHDGSSLTVEALLALLSPMRPREFSIASSPLEGHIQSTKDGLQDNSFNIELCVAVVQGATSLGRRYHGLCSKYLSHRKLGDTVRMWIRPGSFSKIPLKISVENVSEIRMKTPMLCIGAGTGIAPLRSLIRERVATLSLLGVRHPTKIDNVLIFGCRKEEKDYYYRDEWETLQEMGGFRILKAFSRDQWHKIYVQQVIAKADAESNLIQNHYHAGGAIYIAGGPNMARAAKNEIVECISKGTDLDENAVNRYLSELQRAGLYSMEAWS